jgi:hypothetical protein
MTGEIKENEVTGYRSIHFPNPWPGNRRFHNRIPADVQSAYTVHPGKNYTVEVTVPVKDTTVPKKRNPRSSYQVGN